MRDFTIRPLPGGAFEVEITILPSLGDGAGWPFRHFADPRLSDAARGHVDPASAAAVPFHGGLYGKSAV